jgi:TolA-binding protein
MTKEKEKHGKIPKWAAVLVIVIPAVSSAGAAWYGLIKGDPEAKIKAGVAEAVSKKTWRTLRKQVNEMARTINKLHLRVVQFQAKEEVRTAIELQKRIEELEAQLKKKPANGRRRVAVIQAQIDLEKERARRVKAEKTLIRKRKAVKGVKKINTLPANLDEASK